MKWRDAVKAAILHGLLPPDVTLDVPYIGGNLECHCYHRRTHMAPVPLKRKRDMSAEPKTDPAKRAYMRVPDEAKLWFQDFHAYQARVHGKTLRLQHSPGKAAGAGALRARVARHIPQIA